MGPPPKLPIRRARRPQRLRRVEANKPDARSLVAQTDAVAVNHPNVGMPAMAQPMATAGRQSGDYRALFAAAVPQGTAAARALRQCGSTSDGWSVRWLDGDDDEQ